MKRFFVLILALGFIFAGCAQRAVTTQPEQPASQETAQKAAAPETAKAEKKAESKETPTVTKAESEKVAVVSVKEAIEAKRSIGVFENIHFDFDKYYIRDDAKPTLTAVSAWLIKNKSSKMLLEGHCDEWGTNEYNLALGERRAKSTKDYIAASGVEKDRLDMISYGEERPLCKEHDKECWQKNRRVQFILKTQ